MRRESITVAVDLEKEIKLLERNLAESKNETNKDIQVIIGHTVNVSAELGRVIRILISSELQSRLDDALNRLRELN